MGLSAHYLVYFIMLWFCNIRTYMCEHLLLWYVCPPQFLKWRGWDHWQWWWLNGYSMSCVDASKKFLLPPDVVHLPLLLLVEHVEDGPALSVREPEVLGHLVVHLHGPVLVEDVEPSNLLMRAQIDSKDQGVFGITHNSSFCKWKNIKSRWVLFGS